MFKKLLSYAKKYKIFAILAPVAIAIEVLLEVAIPFLMSIIVDCGISGEPLTSKNNFIANILVNMGFAQKQGTDLIIAVGGVMLIMSLFSLLSGAGAAFFAAKAGMGFGSELRQATFDKIQDFSFKNIDKFSTGSLVTRMTTDINMIQMAFMMAIRMLVRSPLMFVMAFSMSVSINARLAVIFMCIAPLMFAAILFLGSKAHKRFKVLFKKIDKLNTNVQENLIGIRVVKAYVRAKEEKEKFQVSNDNVRDASIFAEKLMIMANPVMMISVYTCIILILWFGSHYILDGSMLLGDLMSFITYIQQIFMSLMMISMIFVMSVMAKTSMDRVYEVLTEEPDINNIEADESLQITDGSIDFNNVSFKYSKAAEEDVLKNINLHIKSGETIGILGGTGSAKTSLVQLIPRLYDATDGEVLVAGHNVKNYTIHHLRDSVSMVLQNNVLFSGTIEENLRWGNENATMDEIRAAAKIAQADDFVMSFPEGYNTDLGQGGVNVSGGQKQRLCIARAILKNPKILILDDSTSAVDTATDGKIREGMKNLLPETTKIIIAQRINSIQHADRIIVLDDGSINDIGTHDELLERNEIYKEVFVSQQQGTLEQ
ncbi:MAG: ABC transporter ATP-binding protein [Oscillospiraceae bacterium]|nr:ABC transporter ATP-binding protein [Oscillospiraceae bacterium]